MVILVVFITELMEWAMQERDRIKYKLKNDLERWERLVKKKGNLQKAYDLETRIEEKMRIKNSIEQEEKEINKVEQEIKELENQYDQLNSRHKNISLKDDVDNIDSCYVFISYHYNDNIPPPANINKGWVSMFVDVLEWKLVQESVDKKKQVCMNYQLDGKDKITPDIKKQIEKSTSFVVFLSINYLNSERCQQELSLFKDRKNIFIIDLYKVNQRSIPYSLQNHPVYRFWEKDKNGDIYKMADPCPNTNKDKEYYDLIIKLARDISKKIDWIVTVYLAPVSDSLFRQRVKTVNFLEQYKIKVIPKNHTDLPPNYLEKTKKEISLSSHFIQLLDKESNYNTPLYLNNIAKSVKKRQALEIMQWRNKNISLKNIPNKKHEDLLRSKYVIADNLSNFHREVIDSINSMILPIRNNSSKDQIFINIGKEDYVYAKNISEQLKKEGHECYILNNDCDPEEIRGQLDEYMMKSNYMLVLQRDTPPSRLKKILDRIHYINIKRHNNKKNCLITFLCKDNRDEISIIPFGTNIECMDNFSVDFFNKLLKLLRKIR